MAMAMLDVINDSALRESLVVRGYEYVERNGWGRKKKEYLDLIDALSTELFEDIRPSISASTTPGVSESEPGKVTLGADSVSVGVKLHDPSSASTLKTR
jgi:hypothetical protein